MSKPKAHTNPAEPAEESCANCQPAGLSRRNLLAVAGGVALAGGTAIALSGCSNKNSVLNSALKPTTIAKSVAPGVGQAKVFTDQHIIVSQPTAGSYVALDATCTHAGCLVSGVSGMDLTCPCHGAVYDAANGDVVTAVVSGQKGLAKLNVKVSGDNLDITDPRAK